MEAFRILAVVLDVVRDDGRDDASLHPAAYTDIRYHHLRA
jgi:hypothetical protein